MHVFICFLSKKRAVFLVLITTAGLTYKEKSRWVPFNSRDTGLFYYYSR